MTISRQRRVLVLGAALLAVVGVTVGELLSQSSPPPRRTAAPVAFYNVPSFYASPSALGSSGGCKDLTAAPNGLWTNGVDANNVFTTITEKNGPRNGTFTVSYGGGTTTPLSYAATFQTVATAVATLPGLSGVVLTPNSEMPNGQTNNPLAQLSVANQATLWLSGVPNPDTTPITINYSLIVSGQVVAGTTGLVDVVRKLATGTEVNFTANDCYEVPAGIDLFDLGPSISFNGNPGTYQVGENAELYDPDSTDDGSSEQGPRQLNPILQEDGCGQTSPCTPATIAHLTLKGHDPSGSYAMGLSDNAAGVMFMGTTDDTVNDVHVAQVWGDCITLQVDQGLSGDFVTNTNTVLENISGNNCGRIGISPTSDNGLLVCGLSLGQTGLGDDSFDFENDFQGPFQYATGVVITGNRCQNTDAATGTTVVAQNCYFSGPVVINNLVLKEGPIQVTGCVGTDYLGDGSLVVEPGGQAVTAVNEVQAGPITFSNDQFICPPNGGFACLDVSGPWVTSIRSSTILVANPETDPSLTQGSWNSSNSFIPINSSIDSGRSVKWLYQLRNTGADSLDKVAVTGTACPTASYQQNAGTNNSPGAAPPTIKLTPSAVLTGGSFTLSWGAQHATLNYNASAAQVAAAVQAMIPGSSVTGSGGLMSTAPKPPATVNPITLSGVPDLNAALIITPTTVASAITGPVGAVVTTNAPDPTNVLPPGDQWTYSCIESNVTNSTTDTGTSTGQDAVTGVAIAPDTSQAQVKITGGFLPPTTTTSPPNPITNLNESADALFGAALYLESDCFSGALTPAPYGNRGSKSIYSPTNVTFHPGNRRGCALRTEVSSSPTEGGTSYTDTATVTGVVGPGSPKGTVSFYVCGPTSPSPQACTARTGPGVVSSGSVSLAAVGGNASIISTATSTSFHPTGHGWYCFAAVYSGAPFTGGAYYQPSSDVSDVTSQVVPGGGAGTPYDGCFDVP